MRHLRATCGVLALSAAVVASAQQTASRPNLKAATPPTLRIFLDCSASVTCDSAYVRTAVSYVSYVRDPNLADVHVLLTAEPTGSGGCLHACRADGGHTRPAARPVARVGLRPGVRRADHRATVLDAGRAPGLTHGRSRHRRVASRLLVHEHLQPELTRRRLRSRDDDSAESARDC